MIHIGKLILQQVHEQGICKSELARRLNVSPQNVYSLFKRKTVQASMLKKKSVALRFDFFSVYEKEEFENSSRNAPRTLDSNSDRYIEYRELMLEANRVREENDYLKILIHLMSQESTNKVKIVAASRQKAAEYTSQKTSIS